VRPRSQALRAYYQKLDAQALTPTPYIKNNFYINPGESIIRDSHFKNAEISHLSNYCFYPRECDA